MSHSPRAIVLKDQKKAKQNKKIKWSRCLILLRRIFRLIVVLFGKLGGYHNDCPLTEN